METRGLFITFEGMDGCGKTTQMRRLSERLRASGRKVVETVEPGGTRIGQQIRRILLEPAHQELSSMTEVLLYFASRAQNVDELIIPALARGDIILSDRFTDSSLVYQGYGRGLGPEVIKDLERIACRGVTPDLTILIDIDLDTSLARARSRNAEGRHADTRMDEQSVEFYHRVRDAYHDLATREPRYRVVAGSGTVDEIESRIWEIVRLNV